MAGALLRYPIQPTGPSGRMLLGPGIGALSLGFAPVGHIAAGATWHFTAWYRDPQGPCAATYNASDVLSVTFSP